MAPIDVTILKVKDPSQFWAKEVPGHGSSVQAHQFLRLIEEIHDYCSDEEFRNAHVYNPKKGMTCLVNVMKMESNSWYRAVLINIILRKHTSEASCFLLDYGETISVPISRVREIPERFLQVPFQAREYCLYGLVPLTLKVSLEDDTSSMQPTTRWDTAAVEYFEQQITDKPAKMEIHGKRLDGVHLVTLFISGDQGQVNVNQELIGQKYAMKTEEPSAQRDQRQERKLVNKFSPLGSRLSHPVVPGSQARAPQPVTGGRPANHQSPEEGIYAKKQDKGGLSRGHIMTHHSDLGLSPPRKVIQDQQGSPKSAVPPTALPKRQSTPERHVELPTSGVDCYPGKPPFLWQGPALSSERHDTSSTGQQCPSPPQLLLEQSQAVKAKEVSQQMAASQQVPKPNPNKKLLTLWQAMKKKEQKVGQDSSALPSLTDRQDQALTAHPAPGHAQQIQPSRQGSAGTHSHDTLIPSKPVRVPFISKPLQTTGSNGNALPFSTDGKFSLLPEEIASLTPPGNSFGKSPGKTVGVSPGKPLGKSLRKVSGNPPGKALGKPPGESLGKPPGESPGESQGESSGLPKLEGNESERSQPFSRRRDYSSESESSEQSFQTTAGIPSDKDIGQRLMKQIAPDSFSLRKPYAEEQSQSRRKSRVLVHGDVSLEPMLTTEQAPFPESIHKRLEQHGVEVASDIQAYSWPVILRGMDMVGIASPQAGNSLSYLLPLITQSLQPSAYTNLLPGNGPLVIVVCPSWHSATDIYGQCIRYLPSQIGSKAILIHGAGLEEQQEVQLLNGCSILIATLPCLLRMLHHDHTSLNRLCHLVLDDASVLVNDYKDEVKQLMGKYFEVLRARRVGYGTPHQLLLFSCQWTPELWCFVRAHLTKPTVILTLPLEAAVYSRVRQIMVPVEPSNRDSALHSLLEVGPSEAKRTIIFTNNKEQAQQLQQILLGGYCHYSLLAFQGMPQHHLDTVKKEWGALHRNDSLPILVCTDDIVQELGITDASTVVHYDFPPSKQKFGLRLSCMMDHYSSQLTSLAVSDCQSILLFSKDHVLFIPGLINLLKRCNFEAPALLKMEEASKEKEKSKKSKPLCHQLKAFGECRNKYSCPGRHDVFEDVDSAGCHVNHDQLPSSGVVKILITHVVDATTFYARILEYRKNEASDPVAMPTTQLELALDMALWFSDTAHKLTSELPQTGDLCALEDTFHIFHRVKVHKSKKADRALEVWFVDQGRTEMTARNRLLRLPEHLLSIPYQVVEICVCRVRPLDGDTEWTTQADVFVDEKIHQKQLDGKIVLSLGNTLWLDPLVQRVHLPTIKTTVNINNVRQELLNANYAEDNPEHINNLMKLCSGKIALPDMVKPSAQESRSQPMLLPDPIYLSPSEDFYSVYISSVHSPGCLYMQLVSYAERLEQLMEEINSKLSEPTSVESYPTDWEPRVDEVCLARMHVDNRWNRVKIVEIPSEGRYEVFYLDYGDVEAVSKDWLHPAWNNILMLPFQAIQCSLANISPLTHQWSDAAGDALWDMCLDGAESIVLMAKVVSDLCQESKLLPPGSSQYSIELFDTSSEQDIVLGQQLVHAGLAVGNQALLQSMFPVEATDDSRDDCFGTEVSNELSKLCVTLYQCQAESDEENYCEQITELMSALRQSEYIDQVSIVPLCQLVVSGQGQQRVRDSLAASLAEVCYKNPKNCETMCQYGGLKELCQLLMKTEDSEIQEYISYTLMAHGYLKSIPKYGGIQALCRLLHNPSNTTIVNQVCVALEAIVFNSNENQCMVNEAGGLASVCKLLRTSNMPETTPCLLRALCKMAANGGTRDEIREEGGLLALCDMLWDMRTEELVHSIAKTLGHLSYNNTDNVKVMLHQEMVEAVESQLMCLSHSEETQKLLTTLHIRLITNQQQSN